MIDNASKTILTIDDDDFVREVIAAFLEDSGFNVLQAENGRNGLEVFRQQRPDLILVDLRMPEVDGLEVLDTVTKESPDTPVIVVSGMGTLGDAIRALKLGAWDYIAKPIQDMAVLEHAVGRCIERSELQQEVKRHREHLEDEVHKRTGELVSAYKTLEKEVDERKKAEQVVCRINLELTMLGNCIHAIVRATDEEKLIREICRIIVEVGGYRMAWVGFAEDDEAKTIQPVAQMGHVDGFLDTVHMSWSDTANGHCPTGAAIRQAKPVINNALRQDSSAIPWMDKARERGYESIIALPLLDGGKPLGVLSIFAGDPDSFDFVETTRLMGLADDLSYGIMALRTKAENLKKGIEIELNIKKLQTALAGTVRVVASTVEVRDPYTAGHQRRVANLAKAIGEEMAIPMLQLEGVFMAGVVHDLGKIYVPAEILSKPSRLNEIEFNLIRTHPQVGYDLLKTIEFPWPIADIVYQHHEKINGTGYPNGLKGDEILLEARIITVADVVEAMASHRPYRPARGIELALEEITKYRGTRYDPVAVDACLLLFQEKGYVFT